MSTARFIRDNLRWLAAGFLLTFFSSYGQTFFIALSGGELRAAFNLTPGEYGTLYMIATAASAVTMMSVGGLVDRRPVRLVAAGVMTGLAVACFAMSATTGPIMLGIVFFALRFFGQGMMGHVALTAVGRWFSRNRGKAVTMAGVGYQCGEGLLPLVTSLLIIAIGWRATWGVAGLTVVFIAAPVILSLLAADRTPSGAEAAAPRVAASREWTRGEVVRTAAFWAINAGVLAPPMIGTAIFFHQITIAETKGWDPIWFAASFPLYSAITFFGTLAAGALIDRVGSLRLLPLYLSPLAVGLLFLSEGSSPWSLPLFMMAFALTTSGAGALSGALWPELYGVRHLGAIRSVAMALMVFSSALGPGIMGWMIDAGIDLTTQFRAAAIYCVVVTGSLIAVAVRLAARGP